MGGEVAAGGAIDPGGRASGVMFFFPDRNAGFGFVDEVAAGGECGVTMRGRNAGPDGEIADLEMPDAMDAQGVSNRKFFASFGEDAGTLFFGECGERFVLERLHGMALVMIAHPAFEGDACAGVSVAERCLERSRIEWR